HPAVPLPVDAHKHLALLQVGAVHAARRVRPGAGLIPHRNQVQPPDRPPRRRPLLRQLPQSRGDEHPHPLIGRQDHRRPVRRRYLARRSVRTRLSRLSHVLVLLAAELGNVGRVAVLPNRDPSDLDEPPPPKAGICQRRPHNPRHCEVLISKAIIPPAWPPEQTLPLAGLTVRDEPERETSNPHTPDNASPDEPRPQTTSESNATNRHPPCGPPPRFPPRSPPYRQPAAAAPPPPPGPRTDRRPT